MVRVDLKSIPRGVPVWCVMALMPTAERDVWRAACYDDHEEALAFARKWTARNRIDHKRGYGSAIFALTLVKWTWPRAEPVIDPYYEH